MSKSIYGEPIQSLQYNDIDGQTSSFSHQEVHSLPLFCAVINQSPISVIGLFAWSSPWCIELAGTSWLQHYFRSPIVFFYVLKY